MITLFPEEYNGFRVCIIRRLRKYIPSYDWESAVVRWTFNQKQNLTDHIILPNNVNDFIPKSDIEYIKKVYEYDLVFTQDMYEDTIKEGDSDIKAKKIIMDSKLPKLFEKNKKEDVDTMLKMYGCIGALSSSIFLSVPPEIIKKYSLFELFGSPLNNAGGGYCSPFVIDKKFGSSGSFFDYNFKYRTCYLANPPFDAHLMEKMVDTLIEVCRNTKVLLIIITLPVWDSESQKKYGLKDNKQPFPAFEKINEKNFYGYTVEKTVLLKPDHKYYDHMKKKYFNVSDTHLITIGAYGGVVKDITNLWK